MTFSHVSLQAGGLTLHLQKWGIVKKKKVWEPMSNFRTFLSLCENKNSSLDLSYSHFALLHMVAVLPHVGVITV